MSGPTRLGPPPKYDRRQYYGVETERVQMCVAVDPAMKDPTCKPFYERVPDGTTHRVPTLSGGGSVEVPGGPMPAFDAAITSRHRADGGLNLYWRNWEQRKKWERCLPDTMGPYDVLPPETPEQFEAREALNRTPFNSPDYKKMEKAAYSDLPPTTTETKK